MHILLTIFAAVLTVSLGSQIVYSFLSGDVYLTELLSFSFIVGLGVVTFLLFVINYFIGIPLTLVNIFYMLLSANLIVLLSIFLARQTRKVESYPNIIFISKTIKLGFDEWLFLAIILFILISNLTTNLYWPIRDWDSLTLYDFRALRIFENQNIGLGLENGAIYYFSYTLMTSLSHFLFYQMGFSNPMILYSLLLISFTACFIYLLRKDVGIKWTLFTIMLVISNFEFYRVSLLAYPNLPYAIYMVLSVIYLYMALRDREGKFLIFSSLMTNMAIWNRNVEPFWLVQILMGVSIAIILKKYLTGIFFVLMILAFKWSWFVFLRDKFNLYAVTLSDNVSTLTNNISVTRMVEVVEFVRSSVIVKNSILLTIFFIVFFINLKKIKDCGSDKLVIPFFVFGSFVLLFVGTYILSYYEPSWRSTGDSAGRMFVFINPLILFYVATVLKKISDKSKNSK